MSSRSSQGILVTEAAEIRDSVYDWALIVRHPAELTSQILRATTDGRVKSAERRKFVRIAEDLHVVSSGARLIQISNHINICLTSRQVRDEATAILYSRNIFLYEFVGAPGMSGRQLPPKYFPLLRHVKIRVHNKRALTDPERRKDATKIAQLIRHLLDNMLTNMAILRTLEVQYLGLLMVPSKMSVASSTPQPIGVSGHT